MITECSAILTIKLEIFGGCITEVLRNVLDLLEEVIYIIRETA